MAQQLLDHENLLVVTNNLNTANILAANASCKIILTAGVLRRSDGGLVGELTAELIKNFKFDFSILGCSAIDLDGDLLDFDNHEIMVSQTALKQSRHVMVVADHLKFKRTAPLKIFSLQDVNKLITDASLPGNLQEGCDQWGTEVVLV